MNLGFSHKKLAVAMVVALGIAGEVSAAQVESSPTATVQGRAPTVTVTIENSTRPGQPPVDGDTVIATPVFDDVDGDTMAEITYVWKRGGTAISGETAATYRLTPTDLATILTVEATPSTDSSITDPYIGIPGTATITAGTVAGNKPISIAIHKAGSALIGNPIVGDVLTAVPTCATICDSGLVYSWTAGSGTVGNSSDTYTVTKGDQKKTITVSAPDTKVVKRR